MVKIAEYPRTATFAWSHRRIPQLITGTVAGTIDANFSNDSVLELWDIINKSDKPVASLSTDAKFNDLDWSIDNKVVAGALENGTVEFFTVSDNNDKIESVGKFTQSHKSAVNTIRFNPKQANVLISGDNNGEVLVWDTNKALENVDTYSPMKPGVAMTSIDEVHSLSWNQSLAHVFASAGSSSFASIWDLKAKKEVIHLSYTSPTTGLKPQLSVVEWHPTNSTKLVTATGSDTEPVIVLWDLRNANTPLKTMTGGHSKGIMSLDWCHEDEDLLLSSGRDNTVVLWNPDEAEQLVQYPPSGNWTFKTKFAPSNPDIFAHASFDNKITIQTLQDLSNDLDQQENVTLQHESETEFWNHVSQEGTTGTTAKPIVKKIQPPKWSMMNQSAAASWAFGGKLVTIDADGKSINITKPIVPGMEQNILLNEALKTRDFKPLINVRLVKGIDKVNEDDWNLLDKLSMDGKDEFLRDTFALDDDDEEEEINHNNKDDEQTNETNDEGEQFFNKIENKFEPKEGFKLEKDIDFSLTRKLISGDMKSVINETLDNDLLLESLIIALDSNDTNLKQRVKDVYYSKYGNTSSLSRIIYNLTSDNIEDMVKNLDITQWKYIVKAINKFVTNNQSHKDELLLQLGDRLLESGNRQDAIAIYMSANSIDKVTGVWLSEFNHLEDIIKQENKTIYEAHSECLTEFVERFTVFSSFIGESKISNNALIAKFLEFVDVASASGDFFLAEAFLDILPDSNEDVKTERERVLLASGKSVTRATKTTQQRSTSVVTNVNQNKYRASIPTNPLATPSFPQQPQQVPTFAQQVTPAFSQPQVPAFPQQVPVPVPAAAAALPVKTAAPVRPNPYAPPAAAASNPVSPIANSNVPLSSGVNTSFIPPVNPYAAAAAASSNAVPAPMSPYTSQQQPLYGSSMSPPPQSQPPTNGVLSGQKPHLNQKANDGWNDLPLNVKENKPSRAKAVTVAPVSVGSVPLSGTTPHSVNPSQIGQQPSRMASASSLPTPPPPAGFKRKESVIIDSTLESASKPVNNPYAPQAQTTLPPSQGATSPSPSTIPPKMNPYAPSAESSLNHTPQNIPTNPYAPSANSIPPSQGQMGRFNAPPPQTNPYSQPPPQQQQTTMAPPPITKQTVAPPPPMGSRRKTATHKTENVANATSLLESVQRPASGVNIAQQNTQAPPPTLSTPAQAPAPAAAPEPVVVPEDQKAIIDYLKSELERVTPLTPKEYSKQLKDCSKRLKILYGHMERQDLLTQSTVDKLTKIVECLKNKQYSEAMEIHVDIATHNSQEGGNWLTGVKRLIGIAEATSS